MFTYNILTNALKATRSVIYVLPPSLQLLPLQHSISHSNNVHRFRYLSDPAIIAQAALSSKTNNKNKYKSFSNCHFQEQFLNWDNFLSMYPPTVPTEVLRC